MNQNEDFDFEAYIVREVRRGPVIVMRPQHGYWGADYFIIYSEGSHGEIRSSNMTTDRYGAIKSIGVKECGRPSNKQFKQQKRMILYPNWGEWQYGNFALLRFMQDAISEEQKNAHLIE